VKYLFEFREPGLAKALLKAIAATVMRPWTLMEVVWRPDPCHCPQQPGSAPAPQPAAGARPGLSGLRDAGFFHG